MKNSQQKSETYSTMHRKDTKYAAVHLAETGESTEESERLFECQIVNVKQLTTANLLG